MVHQMVHQQCVVTRGRNCVLQAFDDSPESVLWLIYTVWLFKIATENGTFIDYFPMNTFIYKGFSMAMLNNLMVYIIINIHCWYWRPSAFVALVFGFWSKYHLFFCLYGSIYRKPRYFRVTKMKRTWFSCFFFNELIWFSVLTWFTSIFLLVSSSLFPQPLKLYIRGRLTDRERWWRKPLRNARSSNPKRRAFWVFFDVFCVSFSE